MAGAYPSFCSMNQLRVLLLPLDGMLVHRMVREGTFFLGGGGLGNFGIFFPKKCWPSLAF